jgi:putative DeoR family transcriptional regulator (stage III sporulation protein D)
VKDHIWKRVLEVSRYISRTKATVRETARVFGVSKSTVHKDVTERLPKLNRELAQRVKKVLETNKAERHLRGGEATRRKYLDEAQAHDRTPPMTFAK